MIAQVAPIAGKAPGIVDVVQAWLPVIMQGGFATVCIVLSFVLRTMWNRINELEKDKEEILKQATQDAKEEAKAAQELITKMVEEQTKTRSVIERLERKLERNSHP